MRGLLALSAMIVLTPAAAAQDVPRPPEDEARADVAPPTAPSGYATEVPASYRRGAGRTPQPAGRSLVPEAPPAEPPPPPNVVAVDPLGLALGVITLEYERALGARFSLFASASALFFLPFTVDSDADAFGVGGDLGLRFFFTGHAPAGFWSGVQATAFYVRTEDALSVVEEHVMLGGFGMLGYSWIFGSAFAVSIGAGIGLLADLEGEINPLQGLWPRLRASFGYAF